MDQTLEEWLDGKVTRRWILDVVRNDSNHPVVPRRVEIKQLERSVARKGAQAEDEAEEDANGKFWISLTGEKTYYPKPG